MVHSCFTRGIDELACVDKAMLSLLKQYTKNRLNISDLEGMFEDLQSPNTRKVVKDRFSEQVIGLPEILGAAHL